MSEQNLSIESILARALGAEDHSCRGVSPAIHPATTYQRPETRETPYIRDDNPSFLPAEKVINQLEHGAGCLLFSSGMAACTAPFLALRAGDHVVAPKVMYWGLRNWLRDYCQTWGIGLEFVDCGSQKALAAALKPSKTKLVWLETPANPTWEITDITASAKAAHQAGALLAVDSTVATPLLTRPLDLGADLVVHSATKYLNGHSDVLAGAVVTARDCEFWQRIVSWRRSQGAVPGSFEAWLLLRGMRTLHLRVREASRSAMAIAQHFAQHPKIEDVLYPGLPQFPGHNIAKKQMQGGFGGMLSLLVKGDAQHAGRVAGLTRCFTEATSLGGVESLIEHRYSVEGPDSPVPPNLLRLSVGIENTNDLKADLEQALNQI